MIKALLVAGCLGWLISGVAQISCATEAAPAAPASDQAVARIDGKPIPYAELESSAAAPLAEHRHRADVELLRLKLNAARAQSRELENSLDKLVNDRVLSLEATARKSTAEKLLKTVNPPVPSEAAQHAFYDSQRPYVAQAFEAVQPQIIEFLQGEDTEQAHARYFQSLRDKYHVELLWEPLREPAAPVGPQRGSRDARVTIVEFSDFQCPYCGKLAPILQQLQAADGSVRVIFRNLPLRSLHPNAELAAQAGVCANAQGKFWEMHDAMYADQKGLGRDGLRQKAKQVGLDAKAFEDCLASPQTTAQIRADEDAAEQLGLTSTPSSFVNGRFVSGAMPLYKWQALIDDELRRTSADRMAAK